MGKIDEAVIRDIVAEVINRLKEKEEGIVVGVSNRHLHLSKVDFEALFGPNRQLTKVKGLSQPGEFASAETVNLIGPKGTIKNVRVLGPFRENTQVEISKTDSFILGVTAPVRESGKIAGTPGIVIEGPNGKILTDKGLIAALRHVHMDLAYAQLHGVKNGDIVSVKAEGERSLIFDNVLARVSDKYRLELHLDTDEANASDLKSGDRVRLLGSRETEKRTTSENKVLALFTGGTAGFEDALGQMKKLRDGGWAIDVLFTTGAESLYTADNLVKKFEGFDVYFESRGVNHNFKDIRMLLIPVLTVNTAVKAALGIGDTPSTHLIAGALINGIPVIAAKDACNPRNYRMDHSCITKGAETYARKIEGCIKTIEEYGLRLVPINDLYEAARAAANKGPGANDGSMKKRIVTKADIIGAKQDGSMKVIVDSNTRVTAYAEEIASELGVEILCL